MPSQHGGEPISSWQELLVSEEPPPAPPELLRTLPPALLQAISPQSPCAVLLPQTVLTRLTAHFAQNLGCEQMALLTGRVLHLDATAGWLLLVDDVLPAGSTHATRIHVSMSPQSWPDLWSRLDTISDAISDTSAAPTLLGWAHSHPGHGAFFSAEDRRTQSLWFTQPWHLGIVLDPVTNAIAGFSGPTSAPVTLAIL
jgi:Prokaryotic homologs of the JAB domain